MISGRKPPTFAQWLPCSLPPTDDWHRPAWPASQGRRSLALGLEGVATKRGEPETAMPKRPNCPPPIRVGLAFPGGFEFGGIGRMMLYASDAWARLDGSPAPTLVDARGHRSLYLLPWHLAKACLQLAVARASGTLDLLHLNVAGRGSTLRKSAMSELAGVLALPTVVHLHDYDYRRDFERRGRFGRYLVRRMFERARAVIVLGERDRRTVEEVIGIAAARVVTLANAVPNPGLPPDRALRREPVRILFLGHLDDRKGVPELLRALAMPELLNRQWHIDLAGGGDVDQFRLEAAQLGLSQRVAFHGWVTAAKVVSLCREADLFVLPSHAEGQAMSLLEAMAHGLAIVTTPVGAHLEAVTPGVEALLVPPGDVAALAHALTRLIDDQGLRLRLGAAARARYATGFTIDRYAARLAGLYREALQDSAMHRPVAAMPDVAS